MATADFPDIVARLREILLPHAGDGLVVTRDSGQGMALEIAGMEGKPAGYVGGTRLGKAYVSYYLMPVYAWPDLVASLSPELQRRRQGKACFNFTKLDEGLFAELANVTAAGIQRYRALGWPTGQRQYV